MRGAHQALEFSALSLIAPAEFQIGRRKLLAADARRGAGRSQLAADERLGHRRRREHTSPAPAAGFERPGVTADDPADNAAAFWSPGFSPHPLGGGKGHDQGQRRSAAQVLCMVICPFRK